MQSVISKKSLNSSSCLLAYLKQSDEALADKENLLKHQQAELQKLQQEIDRIYHLFQDQQIDGPGFNRFYQPLEERRKQLESDLPRLQAEIDVGRQYTLSAEEVATEAQKLHQMWQVLEPDEKRNIVEAITEKIVITKDEIGITLCNLKSCKDMVNGWRKGEDSNLR